jgi:HlyD family secretion protein
MKNLLWIVGLLVLLHACNLGDKKADAYGNFEANDIMVSAEATGQLLDWQIDEGMLLKKGQLVGLIDTLSISLQVEKLKAQKVAVLSNLNKIQKQVDVSNEQLKALEIERSRTNKLLEEGAATQQQKDNIDAQVKVAKKQIASISAQLQIVQQEAAVLEKQMELLLLQKEKCYLKSPINARVLNAYVNKNELVTVGKPLYKLADLSEMELVVYVDASQLADLEIGGAADVYVDKSDGGLENCKGKIIWISEEAEFTPKIIQTREERVNLVYAVRLLVKNNGKLKIGMPAEVNFK